MKPRRLAVLALLTPLLVLIIPSAATAAAPVSASGSVTQTSFTVTGSRDADGVTFFTFTETDRLSGTFTGRSVLSGECIQRSTGPILCRADETFSGTVLGESGTADFLDLISIDPNSGTFEGRFIVLSGSGGLAGIHGQGTFQGQGTAGTYSGRLVLG